MPARSSDEPLAEAVLDEHGVELFWRANFGFFAQIEAGHDTDQDGVEDAKEAAAWTDPLTADQDPLLGTSAVARREAALKLNEVLSLHLNGRPASPAEILEAEDAAIQPFKDTLAEHDRAAEARVADWSQRTGLDRKGGGKGQPAYMIIDVVGNRPISYVSDSTLTNDAAEIPPLWPGGTVGSNVTGLVSGSGSTAVRKLCGLWEVDVPRVTHVELIDRISIKDSSPLDPSKPHGSFVAGIIAATGTSPFHRGASYQAGIDAYNTFNNFTELNALSLATIKKMRASNHSYGSACGWQPPRAVGGGSWRFWAGDFAYTNAAGNWEDHKFGYYSIEARTADTTARNKPYHLLVKTAGNDRDDLSEGDVFTLYRSGATDPFIGYGFFYSYYDNQEVLISNQAGGTGKFVFLSDISDFDYSAKKAYIGLTTTLHSLPTNFTLQNDGGQAGGYDSLTDGFTVAKNALCVGAVDETDGSATYSGWGPTDDGRIKPDVVALGGDNGAALSGLGSSANADYGSTGYGTSYAAPAVSGAITLLSQYQENLRGPGEPLRSSTFKALLCHTATDLGNLGPDFVYGWGLVNATAAADLIKNNQQRRRIAEVYLLNNTVGSAVMKAVGGQPVKVTIAWTDREGVDQPIGVDPSGTSAGLKVLTNDMNVSLQRSGGPAALPWVLDPANPSLDAVSGNNTRDTVEQVRVANPITNEQFTIRIEQKQGTTLVGGAQWVSVVTEGLVSVYPPADELTIITIQTSQGSGTVSYNNVTFLSVLGGYYKVQYNPYGQPSTMWFDATGILYSRGDSTTCSFLINSPDIRPLRVVSVAPHPL